MTECIFCGKGGELSKVDLSEPLIHIGWHHQTCLQIAFTALAAENARLREENAGMKGKLVSVLELLEDMSRGSHALDCSQLSGKNCDCYLLHIKQALSFLDGEGEKP
jgi:hypothetical protein